MEADRLVVGECYFLLLYHDKDLKIPDIHSLIYIGKNVGIERASPEQDWWYFQEPRSYMKHGLAKKITDRMENDIRRVDEETLSAVHDWNGLIRELSQNKRAQDAGEEFN